MSKFQACLVAIVFNLLLCHSVHSLPSVYYANMGDTVSIQCNGGPYACFSTYTLQNSQFSMVPLNQSAKYQIAMGSIVINNVQATDAGFYACSSNCYQMNINQISYYLQPMANGQPVDTSASFIPIPPYPNQYASDYANNKYFVVIPNENPDSNSGGLSGGEIAALVIGLVIAAVIFIAILVFLCLLYLRKNKSGEKKLIHSDIKNDKDGQSSVDYSTIERDYNPDNSGTTVNTSSREPMGRSSHQNSIISSSKHSDKDGERKSLASNKLAQSSNPATESATSIGNLANIVGEINTKYMKGPSTYQPNELTLISPQDLPNIDIGFNKTNSQRSQQPTYNNYSNRSFQVDQQQQQQQVSYQQPPPSGKGRIQFPTRPSRPQNVPVPPQQHSQIPQSVSGSQRYVTNESMNLKNIPKDSIRSEPADDPHKQYEGVSDQEGGVTVVSARTPARNGENQQPVVYSSVERQPAPVSRHHHHQQQQSGQKPLPPHLSYSQRIETTSTPLHHIPPPSASVRNTQHTNQAFSLKDGSTDV